MARDPSASKDAVNAGFAAMFARLREILRKHAETLSVSEDTPCRYCLEGGLHPTHKRPMPIAWAQIGKSYVSFHHMGINAKLCDGLSASLKARMQGKCCFNFVVHDEALFEELDRLTADGLAALRKSRCLS